MNERTGYVCIGEIPKGVVVALWPTSEVSDTRVWLNMENVRRHLAAKSDGAARLAMYESNVHALPGCLQHALCFIRYERVGEGEMGLDVIAPDHDSNSTGTYLLVGVRLSEHSTVLNHVTTVYRVDRGCVGRLLARRRAVVMSDGLRR